MSLNQRRTSDALSRLDWRDGLTRDDIVRAIRKRDDMDTSDLVRLHDSLPEGRRFHSLEEVVNAVDPGSWEN